MLVRTGARGEPNASVVLMPRSLLVFADEAYTHALHGIEEVCLWVHRVQPCRHIQALHACAAVAAAAAVP